MHQKRFLRLLLSLSVPVAGLAFATASGPAAQAAPLCNVPEPPPVCEGGGHTSTTRRPSTPPPPPSNVATWFLDANTVHVNDAQEEGIFSNGDEFYIAQIGFRSTPGRAGSTSTFFQGGLSDVSSLDDGDTKSIPDAQGRVAFANVTSRGLTDVLQGQNPEIIGTFSVVFESDATPFSTINGMMGTLAGTARTEIAKVIEPLTLADLGNGTAISARLADAKNRIRSQAAPSTLQSIGIFLGSFGDPDDLVAFKANVFVAVDSSLAGTVDGQLGMNIPSSTGIGGALRDRSYSLNFSGDGANYDVGYHVSR
jgi:hypothetical protein